MIEDFKEIKTAVDELLKTTAVIRRKKKNESDKKRELFCHVINSIEELNIRGSLAFADLQLDLEKYDEKFFEVIDSLIYISFGKECSELISFYLWNRVNTDGTINPVLDEDGNEIFIENPYELYDIICKINPKLYDR
jgi:hypothetical protein